MIIGLTDNTNLRRDGKIRSGYKENNRPVNTEHFLLHDAPQLIKPLGEDPKEIFFTVPFDDSRSWYRPDLRWYTKTELVCVSMHGAEDEHGRRLGSVAAFRAVGQDVAGLTQDQFPRIPNARLRQCAYKNCPDYIRDQGCTEHMFLDIIVPQYSMGALFTVDTTSIFALMNVDSAVKKARMLYGDKLSGQIFRLFKKNMPIKYTSPQGRTSTSEKPVVHMDLVKFSDYEAAFKDKISPEDWDALMAMRGRPVLFDQQMIAASMPPAQLDASLSEPELALTGSGVNLPATPDQAAAFEAQRGERSPTKLSDEEIIRARANDPRVLPLFEEIAKLMGRDNTEQARYTTAKPRKSVDDLVNYLSVRLKDIKKKAAEAGAREVGEAAPKEAAPAEATSKQAPPAKAEDAPPAAEAPKDAEGPLW
jgi:hypothetical protein